MSWTLRCETYVFALTSGQLEEAGWLLRLQARQHVLMCAHCRAFTHNDRILEQLMARHGLWLMGEHADSATDRGEKG